MRITEVTTLMPNGNTIFLLDKKRGHQIDMPMSIFKMEQHVDAIEVASISKYSPQSTMMPIAQGLEVDISSYWTRSEESDLNWDYLQAGNEFILNVGMGDKCFHVPVFLTSVKVGFPFYDGAETALSFVGRGDLQWGRHQPYQVVRFDVGDGTYKEIYLASGETASEVVERWYNSQNQWRWKNDN